MSPYKIETGMWADHLIVIVLYSPYLMSLSAYDPYQDHDDSDHEKNMNEPANGNRADHAQKPKDDKNSCNCKKHTVSSFRSVQIKGSLLKVSREKYGLRYFVNARPQAILLTWVLPCLL